MSDFGTRGKKRGGLPLGWLALACACILAPAAFIPAWIKHRSEGLAESAAWTMTGAPCPSMIKTDYESAKSPPVKISTYSEVTFERRVGHMECLTRPEDAGMSRYPICQFTGPVLLRVKTAKADAYFKPGPGQSVRVAVRNGVTQCVMVPRLAM